MSKFASMVTEDARKGLVVKPLLHSFLYDAKWPKDFSVVFKKGSNRRDPDGWFHPSEHPSWTERQLYYLLTQPDRMEAEVLDYMSTLSVTMGSAMHGFIDFCLRSMDLLLDKDECAKIGIGWTDELGEPAVVDSEAGSRGHMDGVLKNIWMPHHPDERNPLFEFKTTNQFAVSKLEDLDLDGWREMFPSYYAQAQEYLRMSRRKVSIVVMMQMGSPWSLREIHVPYNDTYATSVARKYLSVKRAVSEGKEPPLCCFPGSAESKSCPARGVCPSGS